MTPNQLRREAIKISMRKMGKSDGVFVSMKTDDVGNVRVQEEDYLDIVDIYIEIIKEVVSDNIKRHENII